MKSTIPLALFLWFALAGVGLDPAKGRFDFAERLFELVLVIDLGEPAIVDVDIDPLRTFRMPVAQADPPLLVVVDRLL